MITFCYGTRPEIIKIAPIMWALQPYGENVGEKIAHHLVRLYT